MKLSLQMLDPKLSFSSITELEWNNSNKVVHSKSFNPLDP